MRWLDKIPLYMLVIAALTLGLAPFLPQPHVLEKLQMSMGSDKVPATNICNFSSTCGCGRNGASPNVRAAITSI